jgi:processing peptidase subunit alpha
MSYTIDCLKTGFPPALELLLDCVLNPAFEEGEVEDQKMRLAMLLGGKDIHATLMTEVRSSRCAVCGSS